MNTYGDLETIVSEDEGSVSGGKIAVGHDCRMQIDDGQNAVAPRVLSVVGRNLRGSHFDEYVIVEISKDG